jgi:hypothetical protein
MHPGPLPTKSSPSAIRRPLLHPETPAHPLHPGWLLSRSLFPVVALGLILATPVWGAWVTLILAVLWWRTVTMFLG